MLRKGTVIVSSTASPDAWETLNVERLDGVVTLTLHRPEKKNAINGPMFRELLAVFQQVQERTDDRVLVITGTGGDFCSGADLASPLDPEAHPLERMRVVNEAALSLHNLTKPTIALVEGVAVGAGCNLALGCDLVVAAHGARFSQIFAQRGLSVDFGGSWLLPRLIGLHRAKELALFADIVPAQDAAAMGLVNRVLPQEEARELVISWARRLASGPPVALWQTKQLLQDSAGRTMSEALDAEAHAQVVNFATDDATEALAAFLEKRPAKFSGRSAL